MQIDPSPRLPIPHSPRVLTVVDWTVDPHAVVSALSGRAQHSSIGLLVPAWLHGLDWVGDPTASVPCAARQLSTLERLCGLAGIPIETGAVGDPDPVTATLDALDAWPAEQILLCSRPAHFAAPPVLGLSWRLARATRLPVARVPVASKGAWHGGRRRGSGHCAAAGSRAVGVEVRPSRLRTLND